MRPRIDYFISLATFEINNALLATRYANKVPFEDAAPFFIQHLACIKTAINMFEARTFTVPDDSVLDRYRIQYEDAIRQLQYGAIQLTDARPTTISFPEVGGPSIRDSQIDDSHYTQTHCNLMGKFVKRKE